MVKCESCSKSASFNIEGGKARFCADHKMAGMVSVRIRRCEHENCNSRPLYGITGGKGRFCSKHKTSDMTDVKHRSCEHDGCNLQPYYNIEGGQVRFCGKHRTPEMVNVLSKRCEYSGCNVLNPAFDIRGGKGRFCNNHKSSDMVNVLSKRCKHDGCDVRPSFGIQGGVREYCTKHKTSDMINLKSRHCEYEGCESTGRTFDIVGGQGRFCSKHRTPDMVDVKNKRCEYQNCTIVTPAFDLPGGKGRFCATHKTVDMVNVLYTCCEHDTCNKYALYGKPGNPKSHCAQHRQAGMIKRSNGKCVICKELAIYGTNFTPKHCETHKTEDEQNLVEQECISCHLIMVLDKDNKCEYCHPEAFQSARLAKQTALMNYLDARGLPGTSTDVMVNNGDCGKERPDRVYEFPDKILILECDEHQHRDRQCLCEQTRMINIAQGYGGLPVYFLRWNPDDYISSNERKNPEPLAKRHKLVADYLRDIHDGKIKMPTALVSALYLYYDDWDGLHNEEWKVLTAFDAPKPT